MSWFRKTTSLAFHRDDRGVTAIEFALIMPIFLLLLFGIICYGGYFWMAHDVQQVANDAARAALAGLDAPERQSLAERSVAAHVEDGGSLNLGKTKVRVAERDDNIIVTVSYDASDSAYWRVMSLLPMPSTTIDRSAAVALGGY